MFSLIPIHRKCEEDVTWNAVVSVTGSDEKHAARDCRTRSIQRTATRLNFVDGVVSPNRVEIPDDLAVGHGISAKVSIDGTGKCDSRNRAYGRGLRGTTRSSVAAIRGRRVPHAFAVIQSKREHTPSRLWIRL